MSVLIPLLRVVILVVWLLSPVVFVILGFRSWRRSPRPNGWKARLPLAVGIVVLMNWILFVVLRAESLRTDDSVYSVSRLTDVLLLLSLLAFTPAFTSYVSRWQLLFANMALLSLWVCIAYAPTHWLTRWDFGDVKIEEQSVPATMYIGNPRQREAEAIALVHVPKLGDYFLDFGSETFRQASEHEFVSLHYGVWTWRPMTQGQFHAPLPFRHINECRIPLADGRVVTVAF